MTEDAKKSATSSDAEEKGRATQDKANPEEDMETTKNSHEDKPTPEPQEAEVVNEDTENTAEGAGDEADASERFSDDETGAKDKDNNEDDVVNENSKIADKDDNDDAEEDDDGEDDDDADIAVKIELSAESDGHSSAKMPHDDFQASIREQIENAKFEIVAELQEHIHTELGTVMDRQIKKVERRRRAGFILRDILILLLAVIVGYFGYCLYDAEYFSFFKPDRAEHASTQTDNDANVAEVVKDLDWYKNTYGDLFKNLDTQPNADQLSAYYMYSDDRKVSEIESAYLLSMAFNKLSTNPIYNNGTDLRIPSEELREAFVELFGSAENFAKQDFTHGCVKFTYDKITDSFLIPDTTCINAANRQIREEITEIREEGNVLYFMTTAAIYDQKERSFYTFDNLFDAAVKNAEIEDFAKHASLFNQYQYRFKKTDDKYYFSDITKLK